LVKTSGHVLFDGEDQAEHRASERALVLGDEATPVSVELVQLRDGHPKLLWTLGRPAWLQLWTLLNHLGELVQIMRETLFVELSGALRSTMLEEPTLQATFHRIQGVKQRRSAHSV
jgi:hypothetical protein